MTWIIVALVLGYGGGAWYPPARLKGFAGDLLAKLRR